MDDPRPTPAAPKEAGPGPAEEPGHGGEDRLEIPSPPPVPPPTALPRKDPVIPPPLPVPLVVGRPKSIHLIDEVLLGRKIIALVVQKDAGKEGPGPADLYSVGTASIILKMVKFPDGTLRVLTPG